MTSPLAEAGLSFQVIRAVSKTNADEGITWSSNAESVVQVVISLPVTSASNRRFRTNESLSAQTAEIPHA
jgi:hypothetical protein